MKKGIELVKIKEFRTLQMIFYFRVGMIKVFPNEALVVGLLWNNISKCFLETSAKWIGKKKSTLQFAILITYYILRDFDDRCKNNKSIFEKPR